MHSLLLTNPVSVIYDTVTEELFHTDGQKLWYTSSVADEYKVKLLALFKKDQNDETNIDMGDLITETGMTKCPEKALALLIRVATELLAALAKEEKYQLQYTKMVSLLNRKLGDKREIEQSMLNKFNILLNEKKKEIAALRQQQFMRQPNPNREDEEEDEEEEKPPKKTRFRQKKKVAPQTSSSFDVFMKKLKATASARKVETNDGSSSRKVAPQTSSWDGYTEERKATASAKKVDTNDGSSSKKVGFTEKRKATASARNVDTYDGSSSDSSSSSNAKKAESLSYISDSNLSQDLLATPTKQIITSPPRETEEARRPKKRGREVETEVVQTPSLWEQYEKRSKMLEDSKAAAPNAQNAESYSSDELSLNST